MKSLKVGILGAGFTAGVHSRNLQKVQDVEVVAICDQDIQKANSLASSLEGNNTKVFNDFNNMLNSVNMDVLYICIPPFAHCGEVEAAAAKGIHVFVEKPIALEISRAESMVREIKKAGVYSRVGYHMRLGSAVQELKKLIEQGTAGIPVLYDGRYDCNSLHSPWWRDRKKSGGQVLEQAIHAYDMAMYFLGTPERASGFLSNLCHQDVPGYTVEDTSSSVVRFTSGALATVAATNCAVPFEWNNRFTVVCRNVTVHFDTPNRAEFIFTDGPEVRRSFIDDSIDLYLEETREFIATVRGQQPERCTIVDGLNSLYLVDAVIKSSEEMGKPVSIELFK
ncbi:MAG: Gfo/Idh/MocA family oxidoreductase [Clostridia bacterium]|nr:Gfo/Idh/MocA family oxidoreductase [Clostridia bacterium]